MHKNLTLNPQQFSGLTSEILDFASVRGCTIANLMHHLAYFGASLGRSAHVDWRGEIYANPNFGLIAESGCGKGESFRMISRLYENLGGELTAPLCEASYTRSKQILRTIRDNSESSHDGGENRCFYVDEEFSSQLKGCAHGTGNLTEVLIKLMDGRETRFCEGKNVYDLPPTHYVSVGHTTPVEVNCRLKNNAFYNGYANRIIWLRIFPQEYSLDDGSYDAAMCSGLRGQIAEALNAGSQLGKIALSHDATEEFVSYIRHNEEQKRTNPKIHALLQRMPQMVLKIALILALVNREEKVQRQHINESISLLEYSRQSLQSLFDPQEQQGDPVEMAILTHLRFHGACTRTDLNASMVKSFSRPKLDAAYKRLKANGVIDCAKMKTANGRWPEVFKLAQQEAQAPR